MKGKRILSILGFVLSVILLVACSDTSNGGDTNADNDNDKEKENDKNDGRDLNNNDSESAEDITLRFWYPGDPEEVDERLGEQIGRASCREREKMTVGCAAGKR